MGVLLEKKLECPLFNISIIKMFAGPHPYVYLIDWKLSEFINSYERKEKH
jgi:hypothetical protein